MVKRITKTNSKKWCVAKAFDLRVHFKNTYETAKAIRGMLLHKAQQYLQQVLDHERCVPFTKYDGATGRTGQAKEFGLTHGRWPEKSVKVVLSLLQNAKANAETKKLNLDKLVVANTQVNQAVVGRRRTFRAHGRINAYQSSNCHVQIRCEEREAKVKKAPVEEKKKKLVFPHRQIRKSLAKAYKSKKFVEVGGKQ
jgi:large subunit ribosomal protein L17e